MKKIILLLLLCGLYLTSLKATIIKVDNNFPSIGDYTSIQEAHDAAINGDTIVLTPSHFVYSGVAIFKSIYLLGAGFETSSPDIFGARVEGDIFLNSGADNSIIEGVDMRNNRIDIDADNIIIKKCKLKTIVIHVNHVGTTITKNFINTGTLENGGIIGIYILDNNHISITNNIIISYSNWMVGCSALKGNGNMSCAIYNNVIWNTYEVEPYSISLNSSTNAFYNNIIIAGNTSGLFEPGYNICSGTQLPVSNGNLINVDINTVFVDYQNYNFHLKTGSPAIGAGYDGLDIGIYGGVTPFLDGGYPSIPMIYSIDVPPTCSQQDGVNVTIKARTNN